MKLFTTIVMLSISPFVVAGYDFIVTDGGSADLTLEGHQTLLMTGGDFPFLSGMEFGKNPEYFSV